MNSLIINIFYLFFILDECVECRTTLVSNSQQLRNILSTANAGDTIQLRDGLYSGIFVANRFGTATNPIRLVGSRRAILSNNRGTALYLTGKYWFISGFTVSNSRRGIAVQSGDNNVLERLMIRNIGEEGIVLRQDSDDNVIRNCIITRTGIQSPNSGFGISIGSDERQSYRGYVDRSDRNIIIGNSFQTGSPAEAIHAYEGTCCGDIRENTFDGRPVTNANNIQQFNRFWVTINGNRYTVDSNSGRNTGGDGFRVRMSQGMDGFSSGINGGTNGGINGNVQSNGNMNGGVQRASGSVNSRDYDSDDGDFEIQGCGNQLRRNSCDMNSNGYCIRILNPNLCRVAVYSDNTVTGGGQLTNVAVMNL